MKYRLRAAATPADWYHKSVMSRNRVTSVPHVVLGSYNAVHVCATFYDLFWHSRQVCSLFVSQQWSTVGRGAYFVLCTGEPASIDPSLASSSWCVNGSLNVQPSWRIAWISIAKSQQLHTLRSILPLKQSHVLLSMCRTLSSTWTRACFIPKEREHRGCLAVGVFACLNLFHITAGVDVLTKAPCLPLDSSPFFFASEDLPKPRRRHVQSECQCFDKKLTSVCKNRKYTDQLFFYTPSAVSAKQTSASLLRHWSIRSSGDGNSEDLERRVRKTAKTTSISSRKRTICLRSCSTLSPTSGISFW